MASPQATADFAQAKRVLQVADVKALLQGKLCVGHDGTPSEVLWVGTFNTTRNPVMSCFLAFFQVVHFELDSTDLQMVKRYAYRKGD
jgi:hypothetical protein